MSELRDTVVKSVAGSDAESCEPRAGAPRSRIIDATFSVLMEHGYAGASTREIARRAKVSKRELYALFGSKQGILAAMVAGRAARMRLPLALPDVADRKALAETLVRFGATLMREVCHPAVVALSDWPSSKPSARSMSRVRSTKMGARPPAPRSSIFSRAYSRAA